MAGKRPSSTARRIGVTALFAAAAFASGTTAAHAAVASPSNCTVATFPPHSVGAYCANGTGEFRAYTRCNAPLWPDYNRYGPWVPAGSGRDSLATCDAFDTPFNYGVQVR